MALNELDDIVVGSTVKFQVALTLAGAAVDIRADEVVLKLKPVRYGFQLRYFTADVTTDGLTGIAHFTITDDQSALLDQSAYEWQVWWERGSDTYTPLKGIVKTIKGIE